MPNASSPMDTAATEQFSATVKKLLADSLPMNTEEEWKETLKNFTSNGRTFQDFTQLTPESMEMIYLVAYNQYNAGKFDESEKVFRLLSMLNHFERKYWKGLGASCQALKKYEEALKAYGYLGATDLYDPYPSFHAAKCFVALGKAAEAEAALRATVFNSENKPEFSALHQEAKGLLELLEKASKATPTPTPAA